MQRIWVESSCICHLRNFLLLWWSFYLLSFTTESSSFLCSSHARCDMEIRANCGKVWIVKVWGPRIVETQLLSVETQRKVCSYNSINSTIVGSDFHVTHHSVREQKKTLLSAFKFHDFKINQKRISLSNTRNGPQKLLLGVTTGGLRF